MGHAVRDCTISQRKGCFYCGKQKDHNRAICPTKFAKRSNQQEGTSENDQISQENLIQNGELSTSTNVQSLMATGERVLLQNSYCIGTIE